MLASHHTLVLELEIAQFGIGQHGTYPSLPRYHAKTVLGAASDCQTMPDEKTKARKDAGFYGFYAFRCLAQPDAGSLPLDYQ